MLPVNKETILKRTNMVWKKNIERNKKYLERNKKYNLLKGDNIEDGVLSAAIFRCFLRLIRSVKCITRQNIYHDYIPFSWFNIESLEKSLFSIGYFPCTFNNIPSTISVVQSQSVNISSARWNYLLGLRQFPSGNRVFYFKWICTRNYSLCSFAARILNNKTGIMQRK